MGARDAKNDKARAWVQKNGTGASQATFAEAAAFGEIVFLCARGDVALDVVRLAGPQNLKGKVLIDVSNPLDFSKGMPPSMIPSLINTTSLGEEVQKLAPGAIVVKTLNTMNVAVMVNPKGLREETAIFISGNDAAAKKKAAELLRSFGWQNPIDLGDITTARGTEALLPLWLRLWSALGTPVFNFRIVR